HDTAARWRARAGAHSGAKSRYPLGSRNEGAPMDVFEVVVAVMLGGALLALAARRLGAPYPALVALAGAVMALVPGTPTLVLDPELALALFVAPVLLDAAFGSSLRDLRANWRPIASLAVGARLLTVASGATVGHDTL